MVEKVRDREIFCRERTSTEEKVLGAFLYQSGLSYRKVERFVDRSYEAVRQWYHSLSEFFEPREVERKVIAVDETKMKVDGEQVYVWAGIDVDTFTNQRFVSHQTPRWFETFEVIHVDVSRGRSGLDAFLFLRELLKRCRGKPLIKVDRGPRYDWALETLGCDYDKETFGEWRLVEAWFGLVKYRTMLFWHRFPYRSTVHSTQRWTKSFATLHNSVL